MTSSEPKATKNDDTPVQTTLLVVEDDEDIGAFLTQAIQLETPYQPLYVTTAAQALEAVRSVIPSLFLLDYRLPDLNGLELVDRLHLMEGVATVPVLMISANPPSRQALQQRHVTFLKKPFELHELLKIIERLLARRT